MNKARNVNKLLDIICTLTLIIACFIVILVPKDNTPFRNRMTERLEDFSKGWETEEGKKISLSDLGRLSKKDETGKNRIKVHNEIPKEAETGASINFRSKSIRFRVIIDKREIYVFEPSSRYRLSKGTGHTFHTVAIAESDRGKRVELDVEPIYHDGSSAIRSIYIGRASDFQGMIIDQKFNGFILCIFTIVIGILLVVTSLATKSQRRYGYRMRILGMLAICVGVWSLFETLIIQLLFGYSPEIHDLTYILLIAIPYYLIAFVNTSIELRWKYSKRISFVIIILELGIMTYQMAVYDRDFHDSLAILHLSMMLNVALTVFMIIRSYLHCRKNKIKNIKMAAPTAVFLFMLLSTIDIIRYQFDKGVNDAGTFMRIGIFFSIIILSVDLVRNIVMEIKNTEHMETMARLAYTDALTGMANRTAFEKKEKELEIRVMKGDIKKVYICQLDLNFLKKVNDNYGHAIGDRHIRACSKIINDVFGDHGFAFRIGGDEFTVFVTSDITEGEFREKIQTIKRLEAKYNETSDVPVPLHMAVGYVLYTKTNFSNIKEAENEADKKMYVYKEAMKKKGDFLNDFKGKN